MRRLYAVLIALAVLCLVPLLTVVLWPTHWDVEEGNVYDAVIKVHCIPDEGPGLLAPPSEPYVVLVEDRTDFMGVDSGTTTFPDPPSSLRRELFHWLHWGKSNLDFVVKNRQSFHLPRDFASRGQYVVVSRAEVDDRSVYDRYRNQCGVLTFSRVGFNWRKDQATVYFESGRNVLGGAGYYVYLKRSNDGWVVEKKDCVWIS